MPHRLYDDNKIKLILLYLLKELDDALDYQTISEIIVWDGSINYFVFNQCFNQLVENGSILKEVSADSGKELYSISPTGKSAIEAVEDSLLKFIRERIMRSATRLLAFKKDGSGITSSIEPMHEGYQLTCTIQNKKFPLMELKMYLDYKEEAEVLRQGFDDRAEHIYSAILTLLSDDTKYIL